LAGPGRIGREDGARLAATPSAARQNRTGRGSLAGRATHGSFALGQGKGHGIEDGKPPVAW
jgi:hypothetical protein